MSRPNDIAEHGVHATSRRLAESLRSYLEAQYHIRNEAAIRERRALLDEDGAVCQVPFVESTPVYELGEAYQRLAIPTAVRETLSALAQLNAGVFPRPYVHQARALEQFFSNTPADLIVATGTGSGKTESFLMPIIGHLALEAARNAVVAHQAGCRAILLYPMNALVNDQNSRIRRLFGEPGASAVISQGRGRPIRFATYTGRTPYPGPRNARRDGERIAPLFESFYLPLMQHAEKVAELRAIGQWPAKDIAAFFGAAEEEVRQMRGGPRRMRHWDRRLLTQAGDRELLTRHETQNWCPDILITNYSMLEYMLMRPIERPIFSQTRDWLRADPRNELVLVLDEAHMYRGAGGAEVALLLRRLAARLDVPRERVRYVLTSASLGEGEDAKRAVIEFACDLTGLAQDSVRKFALITGEREHRVGQKVGDGETALALAGFDLAAFQLQATDPTQARTAVSELAGRLGWRKLKAEDDLADYLYEALSGFGPLELLIGLVSGKASALPELQDALFPGSDSANRATATLLALATFAKRRHDGRILLPTRLHMFFRGLPGLYACADLACSHARVSDANAIIGRLHTHLRDACDCGSRVYELFTHRECGSAFLRGYMTDAHGDFLWHIPSGHLREGYQTPLVEVELLIESEPHPEQAVSCIEAWLDVRSGKLVYETPTDRAGFRRVFLPGGAADFGRNGVKFVDCPVCNTNALRAGRSAIMDHSTKGEAPFANLIKTQLDIQPPVREENRTFPNGGRKVLLFSDGRQKAARLARDIPREVEQDIFRQILLLAAQRLADAGYEPKPTRHMYTAVLTVLRDFNLPLFDRADAATIENQIERLEKDHEGEELAHLLLEFDPGAPPPRYTIALLKQLCGRYYSLVGTSVGYLAPSKKAGDKLVEPLSKIVPGITRPLVEQLALAWIAEAADKHGFDREVTEQLRSKAAGFWTATPGTNGRFSRPLRDRLPGILAIAPADIEPLEAVLRAELALKGNAENHFLDPSKVKIVTALETTWHQCADCTGLRPFTIAERCSACGADQIHDLNPRISEYIRARKGFWRTPVQLTLDAKAHLRGISVEEHTAQLSNRDNTRVHATTEQFELRFRDIRLSDRDRPIDVLSCTTTMEVGVDIGSLVAVGLRNVPPQRENYQQRAGRAGRRGSSVSSVLTYAQNGPHDSYYYNNPRQIVAGAPRNPDIKTDNPKIARRHVNSFLVQTFFHRFMDEHQIEVGGATSALFRALGKASEFFHGDPSQVPTFSAFATWLQNHVIAEAGDLRRAISTWLPQNLRTEPLSRDAWIRSVTQALMAELEDIKKVPKPIAADNDDDDDDDRGNLEDAELMDFLFDNGLLPSYAFPTDLTSFLIERLTLVPGSQQRKMEIVERPQQGIQKALSEYAPGRLIVINKETYRSGGVVANVLPTTHDRAAPLFADPQTLIHCDNCSYVRDIGETAEAGGACPICGVELQSNMMIVPQVFTPEDGRALDEDDRDQEITYATGAQYPVPVDGADVMNLTPIGARAMFTVATDRRLVTTNKGQLADDTYQGFWICDRCGRASTEEPPAGAHQRPYAIEPSFVPPKAPNRCNGAFQNVFLGHVFSTDLLLLRITVAEPLNTDTHDTVVLRALEDGLYSIAEAFRLSASRHPHLDLDASEFGAGFRIVPTQERNELHLDVYLFDTLSGGAGYSELAGRHLAEILASSLDLLENCPARCDRSCESCLRHYHNQHLKNRLDRRLGAQLLRYALNGTPPEEPDIADQAQALAGLKRLLELDGLTCRSGTSLNGVPVPLVVSRDNNTIAVGTKSCFVVDVPHSLDGLVQQGIRTLLLRDYVLRQNLPDEHQLIRQML
ncbi:MAG: DEAD/DEAH box helicase [Alphaproteobacteria bacterium]|nr:DEAD/DEAH box helicase [Alphaproteobacteria bacterium]